MRRLLLTCAFLLSAMPAGAGEDGQRPDPAIAAEMGYRTMANGAIVYEEIVPESAQADTPIEEIAPAAGSGRAPAAAPVFRYDPLTQTYRRVTVDKQGNTRHDVINTAR